LRPLRQIVLADANGPYENRTTTPFPEEGLRHDARRFD
jgi:hypothetical protein